MTTTSVLGLALLMLFGAAIIAGALNAKKLIAWENHALTSLADAVRDYRETLEAEQCLFEAACAPQQPAIRVMPVRRGKQRDRAA